jgi:hypothetical protein
MTHIEFSFHTIILLPILLSVLLLGWGTSRVLAWASTPHYAIPGAFFERWEMLLAYGLTIIVWITYFMV